jgi:hypothetical protein
MGHHIHVRLQPDIGGHRLADAARAARNAGTAMDVVDLNDRRFGVIHRGRGIDILRIEGACEPEIAKVR